MENSFFYIWTLLDAHGAIPNKKAECETYWNTFTLDQQRYIYRCIRDKLRAGKFVNYNPVKAIRDNAPKPPKIKILSYEKYVEVYHTDLEKDGWVKKFLPEERKTIYVKETG